MRSIHENHMKHALALAERGRETVSPNPMVGCVIVNNDTIVGEGFHQQAGLAHAEVIALAAAKDAAKGATVYVTLEPCCHTGRTGPCTTALINAGVKKIIIACEDPNPLVAGKGINVLRAAGIEVEVGVLQQEAINLNKFFFHYIRTQRPFVIAKWAMSLDGKTITATHDTRDISSLTSQRATHHTRQQVDAILIGAGTALQDNPQLTVRHTEKIVRQPLRIIISGKRALPQHLHLFNTTLPSKTIVVVCAREPWHAALEAQGIELLTVTANQDGQVDLSALLFLLGKREITSLLVEGGMTLHEQFFKHHLVNEVQVYLAPVIIGQSEQKQKLNVMTVTSLAEDYLLHAQCEERDYV